MRGNASNVSGGIGDTAFRLAVIGAGIDPGNLGYDTGFSYPASGGLMLVSTREPLASWFAVAMQGMVGVAWVETDWMPIPVEHRGLMNNLDRREVRIIFHASGIHVMNPDVEFWVYQDGTPVQFPRRSVAARGQQYGGVDVKSWTGLRRVEQLRGAMNPAPLRTTLPRWGTRRRMLGGR